MKTTVFTTLMLAFGLFTSTANADEFGNRFSGPWPDDIKGDFQDALLKAGHYMGQKSATIDKGRGAFCQKSVDYSVFWDATLGDFHANVDPKTGTIQLHLEFDHSSIEGSGFRKGGVLCEYEGGGARISAGNVAVDFHVQPAEDGNPNLGLDSIQIQDLAVDHFQLAIPFFSIQNGTAPDWLVDAIESNFNKYVPKFLASSLGSRFNGYLSRKLKDFLDAARDDDFHGL